MKKTGGIIVGVGLLIAGWFLFTNNQNQEQNNEGLSVATSFYPLQFALDHIVGELGTVTNIGAGRDPHNFEPSIKDVVILQRSDTVVLQGADFEPWGDDVVARLEVDGIPVIIATANIDLHKGGHEHEEGLHEDEDKNHDGEYEENHNDEHSYEAYDPHTWLDPVLFSETVEHLAKKIATLDSSNADIYMNNAFALQAELESLHFEYQKRLANCELDEVITSHDAFGYLGDRYNFNIHSIAGLSTQDTPSVTVLAGLKEEAEEGIGAILLEENSITAYGDTLARETGLKTLSINPVSYVIPENENYLTLMQKNLDSFATALVCDE